MKEKKEKNVHRPGIEPGPPAWQASILPLNHRCLHIISVKAGYLLADYFIVRLSSVFIDTSAIGATKQIACVID